MKLFDKKLFRGSLLSLVYALGVFFIVASGGSGSGSGSTDNSCRLVISAVAPVVGSDDIWISVLSELPAGDFNSVVRLKRDGSEALPPIPLDRGSDNVIRAIAVDALSKGVYVGGDFSEGIFRLNEDGSLDNAFAVGSGFNGPVSTIVPVADGSGNIYVGGFFSQYQGVDVGGLVRLTPAGSLDAKFAGSQAIQAVARAGSTYPGSVYSGGYVFPRLARWSSTAFKDSDFTPSGGIGPVFSIALVAGGFGAVYAGGDFSPGIYRLSNTGRTDNAFAVGSGFNDSVRKIVHTADSSGDIYALGEFTTYQDSAANGLVRLNPDGSPEVNFFPGTGFNNADGPVPFSEFASSALAADASGDLFVGGDFTDYDGTTVDGLVRLNDDGSLDSDFAARISSEGGTCTDGIFKAS